ncbi:MAG: DEAD/DEAH box helicase family protein [Ectothiorhodospiraceae bacterium AqS1]|nr:DEAD/DEAH box helicase family protein [Ectothiorhodospiraceae bacterium AqS1]MBF2761626.1 DEAD/DEAH box helicase family protein [Ectothiorhodospiraceae bacterium AqS1]
MGELLAQTTAELHRFLDNKLPSLGDNDWWNKRVVDKLSFSQQRHIEQRGIGELAGLDLAALIRIFDQNWFDLNWKESFPPDVRHFVKEMQIIRNRWAHVTVEQYSKEDIYRDLDTLQRFLALIDAGEELRDKVESERKGLLALQRYDEAEISAIENTIGEEIEEVSEAKAEAKTQGGSVAFQPPQIVQLISNPSMRGPVLEVQEQDTENRYKVFIDGAAKWFYESQLEEEPSEEGQPPVSLNRFHAHLTALHIQHPNPSTLYSLNAARVDFIPYQFRPVLKFIRADRPRLLIADGVGVGKTIEAGLILRELQARREVRSVLIICPRPLVAERKWMMEMKRFEERFTQLDGKMLRHCISETELEGQWPEQHAKTILPYSLLDEAQLHGSQATGRSRRKRKQIGLLDLDPPPRFDLVIVDEAHHARNPGTYTHEAVRFFCENAEAVVFLTATPLMLGNDDLFVLLNLLRPDLIIDKESFRHIAEPNPHINRAVDIARGGSENWQKEAAAALEDALRTDWGSHIMAQDPECIGVKKDLTQETLTLEDRVGMIHRLEGLHTFSGIINRTRRRDIGEFTIREPQTIEVQFTEKQRELHDALIEVQSRILSKIHSKETVNFMVTTLRRQAASCLYGLAPFIDDILNRRIEGIGAQESSDEYELLDHSAAGEIMPEIREVAKRAKRIDGTEDPKLQALKEIIRDKQDLENNKLMIFSSFRHTLDYLFPKLLAIGIRVGMVHGGTPDDERITLRDRFKQPRENPDTIDVLLFSEVGCEGLDYQFCDCIVNYDLPWNPMRIEQRIGRIDRRGQKSEKTLIYNLITPDTVDADIYERCLMRIGVFNDAIGAGEEILGTLAKEIRNIGENIQLTESERREKLQQIADNEVRLIREKQALEDKEADFFGIQLPADQAQKDIEGASSYWLSPVSVKNLVENYLHNITEKTQDHILGEKATKSLRISHEGRTRLLKDYQALPRSASTTHKEWENWLKGSKSHLAITFETQEAVENRDATFITPLHPLVRQAASAIESSGKKPICIVQAIDDEIPAGHYPFVIYEWQYLGVRKDLRLYPIAQSPEVTKRLSSLLEHGRTGSLADDQMPKQEIFDALEKEQYRLWSEARSTHQEKNRRVADHRRESLKNSHLGRMAMLNSMLDQATNEKIRRMREGQLANAEADYQRRIKELDEAVKKADLNADPVAYGVVVLTPEKST